MQLHVLLEVNPLPISKRFRRNWCLVKNNDLVDHLTTILFMQNYFPSFLLKIPVDRDRKILKQRIRSLTSVEGFLLNRYVRRDGWSERMKTGVEDRSKLLYAL